MPKLRPISLQLLKTGNRDEAIRVIKDLLILTPRGMSQRQRATDYVKHNDYPGKDAYLIGRYDDQHRGHNRGYVAEDYGYTSLAMYYALKNLGGTGTHLGEWDIRKVCSEALGIYSGAKLTRSSNRIYRRCHRAWTATIASGALGDMSWSVTIRTPTIGQHRYNGHTVTSEIYFAAKTEAEAAMMLNTMFTHAIDPESTGRFSAWKVAEPAEVMSINIQQVEKLRQRRATAKAEIEQLQKHIANIETLEEAITMYSMTACSEDN